MTSCLLHVLFKQFLQRSQNTVAGDHRIVYCQTRCAMAKKTVRVQGLMTRPSIVETRALSQVRRKNPSRNILVCTLPPLEYLRPLQKFLLWIFFYFIPNSPRLE